MSDWQAGDLAVCVHTEECLPEGIRGSGGRLLTNGAVYRVADAGHDHCARIDVLWLVGLRSGDAPTNGAFAASRFRKILPDQHEPCEAEFVTLLKRTKKTVRA